jgi:hypothetical protein
MVIKFKLSNFGYNLFSFFNQRFGVELYYNKYISGVIFTLGGQTSKEMDKGIVEKFGPYGLQRKVLDISTSINNLSTGVVTSYALYILVCLLFYISIIYLNESVNSFCTLGIVLFIFLIFSLQIRKIENSLKSDHSLIFPLCFTIAAFNFLTLIRYFIMHTIEYSVDVIWPIIIGQITSGPLLPTFFISFFLLHAIAGDRILYIYVDDFPENNLNCDEINIDY